MITKGPFVPEVHAAIRTILTYIGEDPDREGLKDTPNRMIFAFSELFSGYHRSVDKLFTTFEADNYDELVLLRGVSFCSFCEHHALPFTGTAHIAYIPDGKVIGLSKLARVLEVYTRRLQIQERITKQVTDALDTHLQPLGSACILEAHHACLSCRGVQKQDAVMITSSLTGVFREDGRARSELLQLISWGRQ